MSGRSIWERRYAIEKAQRGECAAATKDIRARYVVQLKALQRECETSGTGHNWRFTGEGILPGIHWYACTCCALTKSVDGRGA